MMNAYWMALPFLACGLAYTVILREWVGITLNGILVALDVFAGVIVTLGDNGIFPLG